MSHIGGGGYVHKHRAGGCFEGGSVDVDDNSADGPDDGDTQSPSSASSHNCDGEENGDVLLRIETDILYKFHSYKMRLNVDSLWRQSMGMSPSDISNHVLKGKWLKYGTLQEALCQKCNTVNGAPVEITLWSLPDVTNSFDTLSRAKEVFIFNLTTKCTSTKAHLKSEIVLVVSSIPGAYPFSSNPITICARDRHRQRRKTPPSPTLPLPTMTLSLSPQHASSKNIIKHPMNLVQKINLTPPAQALSEFRFPTFHGTALKITPNGGDPKTVIGFLASEIQSLRPTSDKQSIVDSRSVQRLPESTIAAVPEVLLRRPAIIFVTIVSIADENFEILYSSMSKFQFPLEFILQYAKIANNLYVITTKHQSVESFCYASSIMGIFAKGNNPFHVDLTQPNPIFKFIGWANNTFAQIF
ncbi:hypothetical protein Pelo_17451 [Pelomyxa schiedti]|nr:hypothetical protein Pelo_17451 [Pelomyxa schiedti]